MRRTKGFLTFRTNIKKLLSVGLDAAIDGGASSVFLCLQAFHFGTVSRHALSKQYPCYH
jgi:hypothetical protein